MDAFDELGRERRSADAVEMSKLLVDSMYLKSDSKIHFRFIVVTSCYLYLAAVIFD